MKIPFYLRFWLYLAIGLFLFQVPVMAGQWDKDVPASGDALTSWPTQAAANGDALDRMLANYQRGMALSYSSGSTIVAGAGEVMVSNSGGTVRLMLKNAASTNITFADLDTGVEASGTTYYVYAIASATSDETATFKISASSSAPSGITYYKRLGSFINDSGSSITAILNDIDIPELTEWTSKTISTTYQALTDGFVTAYNSGGTDPAINCLTDGSSPPTTVRSLVSHSTSSTTGAGCTMPVRRGDYYRVTTSGGSSTAMFFIPLS